MSRQTILIFLGVLFVINLFFRARIMMLMRQIKAHNIRLGIGDLISNEKFDDLVHRRYPEHAELITRYRKTMMMGIGLIILVVVAMLLYVLMNRT